MAEVEKEIKTTRRGLGNARGVTRLKFSHEDAANNGLFKAHIENVEVKEVTINEEATGMPSFSGLNIPKLVITFASNEAESNKRKYVTLSFTAVESNAENIPGGKNEWKVNSVLDYLKHLLDVFYFKGRELTKEEMTTFSLSFEDFDDDNNYVPVDPETVIAGWKSLFTNVATALTTGAEGKPVYVSKDGKFIPLWVKLIRYYKDKNNWKAVNRGELAFPSFVGEGVIEIFKANTVPTMRFNVIKECITPKDINKPKPAQPAMFGGGIQVPIMTPNLDPINVEFNQEDDMPF